MPKSTCLLEVLNASSVTHLLQFEGGGQALLALHPWNHAPRLLPAEAFEAQRKWHTSSMHAKHMYITDASTGKRLDNMEQCVAIDVIHKAKAMQWDDTIEELRIGFCCCQVLHCMGSGRERRQRPRARAELVVQPLARTPARGSSVHVGHSRSAPPQPRAPSWRSKINSINSGMNSFRGEPVSSELAA